VIPEDQVPRLIQEQLSVTNGRAPRTTSRKRHNGKKKERGTQRSNHSIIAPTPVLTGSIASIARMLRKGRSPAAIMEENPRLKGRMGMKAKLQDIKTRVQCMTKEDLLDEVSLLLD